MAFWPKFSNVKLQIIPELLEYVLNTAVIMLLSYVWNIKVTITLFEESKFCCENRIAPLSTSPRFSDVNFYWGLNAVMLLTMHQKSSRVIPLLDSAADKSFFLFLGLWSLNLLNSFASHIDASQKHKICTPNASQAKLIICVCDSKPKALYEKRLHNKNVRYRLLRT